MTPVEMAEIVAGIARDGIASGAIRCGLVLDEELGQDAEVDGLAIRVTVIDFEPTTITHGAVGNRLIQHRGRVVVQAFAAKALGDGVQRSRQLAQDARDLYHASTVGADPITFGPASVQRIPSGSDPWIQHNASIPFAYHERA